LSHANRFSPDAGFTLIEVLVALVVLGVVLSSIGAMIATTVRGTRSVEQRLAMMGVATTLFAGLPERTALQPGRQSGETSGFQWQIEVVPFAAPPVGERSVSAWIPFAVSLRLQAGNGPALQLNTVRLVRRSGE